MKVCAKFVFLICILLLSQSALGHAVWVLSPELGFLKVGPTIATRMACPGPAMEIEARFVKQLEAVTNFKTSSGQLTLKYELDGTVHWMMVEKK